MSGSQSNACGSDGRCTCKTNYEGDKCNKCTKEFYMTQKGCTGTSFMFRFIASSCLFLQKYGSQSCRLSLLPSF